MAIRPDRLRIDAMPLVANDDRGGYQVLSDDSTSLDRPSGNYHHTSYVLQIDSSDEFGPCVLQTHLIGTGFFRRYFKARVQGKRKGIAVKIGRGYVFEPHGRS